VPFAVRSAFGLVDVAIDGLFALCVMSTLPVSPETRLIAPGDEGPYVGEYELSLIAKCCA
jgi:hypothetical protein